MTEVTKERVIEALRSVRDPQQGTDIVKLEMVTGVVVKGGNVGFAIEVDPARGKAMEPVRKAAEQAVMALDGVTSVTAVLTAHNETPSQGPGQVIATGQLKEMAEESVKNVSAIIKKFSDEDISDLAAYYASLPGGG